jgi:hypothetical protein
MAALELADWPADQTLAVSGEAGSLRIAFNLRNESDRAIKVAEMSLANVKLGGDGAPLRTAPIPVGLVAPAKLTTLAKVRLRLDPATPPGLYEGGVRLAHLERPVAIEVIEQVSLAIQPAPVVIDAALGRKQRFSAAFENRGNVPLTIDVTGVYPLGLEQPFAASRALRAEEGVARLGQLLDEALGLTEGPAVIKVGTAELSMPNGPASLAPGASATLTIEIALPEGLAPAARHHVFAPVYASDLHVAIVTAAKSHGAARRTRTPKSVKGEAS